MSSLEARLARLVCGLADFLGWLRALRQARLPQGLLGAGAVRDLVWDHLHQRPPQPPRDLDVAFFDPLDLSPARDAAAQAALLALAPGAPWEATNQAAVHLWFPERFGQVVQPLGSCAEAVASWPETATCVGLRLDEAERLEVLAPLGLEDLFGLVLRRNPSRVSVEEFRRRARAKDVARRWPRVRQVD